MLDVQSSNIGWSTNFLVCWNLLWRELAYLQISFDSWKLDLVSPFHIRAQFFSRMSLVFSVPYRKIRLQAWVQVFSLQIEISLFKTCLRMERRLRNTQRQKYAMICAAKKNRIWSNVSWIKSEFCNQSSKKLQISSSDCVKKKCKFY